MVKLRSYTGGMRGSSKTDRGVVVLPGGYFNIRTKQDVPIDLTTLHTSENLLIHYLCSAFNKIILNRKS